MKVSSISLQNKRTDKVAGWTIDESDSIPIFRWIVPRRVQRVSGSSRVPSVVIDLAYVFGDRLEQVVIRDRV